MRVLVLGASGRTGRELLRGALRDGHEVRALVRDAGRLELESERLSVLVGRVTDPATVEKAALIPPATMSPVTHTGRPPLCAAESTAISA